MKQLIIYEKDTGHIVQVMSFRKHQPTIESLGLTNRFDKSVLRTIVVEDSIFIDIRKDTVSDGILCSSSYVNSQPKKEIKYEDMFQDVSSIQEIENPHKIGLVTPWRQQCGIAEYSEDLASNLLNNVTVFCERGDDTNHPTLEIVDCWSRTDSSYNNLAYEIKKREIDIVHVQYNHGLMNAGELKKLGDLLRGKGIYTILTLHSTKGGVEVFSNHFNKIVVHSKSSKQDLMDLRVSEEKLQLIRIGSVLDNTTYKMSDARKRLGLSLDRPIISTFGFLLPQKGVLESLDAINILRNTYSNILFIICCAIHKVQNNERSKAYHKECEEKVKKLGLENNILFITDFLPFDKVYEYLCASNIVSLAYTSSAEQATSSAGRTALSSLRPVIVSDVEIFDDLKGVVPKVQPRNFKELAKTIDKLLKSKQDRLDIIVNIKRFLKETSWKNIANLHSMMYKAFGDISIHIEGQVFSYFSASIVNRRLACALDDIGVNVSLSSANMAENDSYEMGDKSKELVKKKRTKEYCMRHQYPPKFSDIDAKVKIAYLPVETTSVPNNVGSSNEAESWIENINKYIDQVWVYTTHGKKILSEMGVQKPITVIPCGYDENLFNKNNAKKLDFSKIKDSYTKQNVDIDEDTFIFMFCGHAQKRKNCDVILKAYFEEFSSSDNVLFVIKSYDGGEIHEIIEDSMNHAAVAKMSSYTDLPKHLYIYEDSPPEKMPVYYFNASCMVQCSRAEGFGLPIVEAMAMGTPSIVTPWGGPLDFTTKENSYPVKFELVESDYHVQSKIGISYWAEVDFDNLKQTMRQAFEDPIACKRKGQNGRRDMRLWTSKHSALKVIEFIRKIEQENKGRSSC